MNAFSTTARAFLEERRVAVAGVSRSGDVPANHIARKLRDAGYEVFALNPSGAEIDGHPSYASLADVPGPIGLLVIGTPPAAAPQLVAEGIEKGVRKVWMHRSMGQGSASAEAERICREHGIEVLAAGCPMMFVEPVDGFHRCMRWLMGRGTGWQHAPA